MKNVVDLYQGLVETKKVRGVVRFNLRRFARSLNLPPWGLSFWLIDDLNWDYLQALNNGLERGRVLFLGGERFPGYCLEHHYWKSEERIEFIFLQTRPRLEEPWQVFLDRYFSEASRAFGEPVISKTAVFQEKALRARLKRGLYTDLMRFSDRDPMVICDLYLTLLLLTFLPAGVDVTRDEVFQAIQDKHPAFRGDIARIKSGVGQVERVDDILVLLEKLDQC